MHLLELINFSSVTDRPVHCLGPRDTAVGYVKTGSLPACQGRISNCQSTACASIGYTIEQLLQDCLLECCRAQAPYRRPHPKCNPVIRRGGRDLAGSEHRTLTRPPSPNIPNTAESEHRTLTRSPLHRRTYRTEMVSSIQFQTWA